MAQVCVYAESVCVRVTGMTVDAAELDAALATPFGQVVKVALALLDDKNNSSDNVDAWTRLIKPLMTTIALTDAAPLFEYVCDRVSPYVARMCADAAFAAYQFEGTKTWRTLACVARAKGPRSNPDLAVILLCQAVVHARSGSLAATRAASELARVLQAIQRKPRKYKRIKSTVEVHRAAPLIRTYASIRFHDSCSSESSDSDNDSDSDSDSSSSSSESDSSDSPDGSAVSARKRRGV